MKEKILTSARILFVALLLIAGTVESSAQVETDTVPKVQKDSLAIQIEQTLSQLADTAQQMGIEIPTEIEVPAKIEIPADVEMLKDWSLWRPDPKRALWLALVIPGGGQIYNRKYWKLPIVYGGFIGCLYAMNWNNTLYKDYSQAYLDIMDNDPNTQSYNQFLHLGMQITPANEARYKDIFKKRKDRFRRWRDMSFFVMVGVYALSVIDAYVDAELSVFDISKDLSLRVEPTIMNNGNASANPLNSSSVGLQCSLNF